MTDAAIDTQSQWRRPPLVREFETLELIPQVTEVTQGGITLHIIDTGNLPANRITVMTGGGRARSFRDYGSCMPGMMWPMMLREGSASLTGAEIAERFDFEGAIVGQRVTDHWTSVEMVSLNETTPRLLDLLAEIMTQPAFPARVIEQKVNKTAMMRELELTRGSYVAREEMRRIMLGEDHRYMLDESPDEIHALKRDDVIDCHHRALADSEIHIFAAGRLDEVLLDAVRRFAGQLRPQCPSDLYVPEIPSLVPPEPVNERIDMEGQLQEAIVAAFPGVMRTHPDYDHLRLSVIALGGYFGSRLMTNIREDKGLTYGISAALYGTHEGSYGAISAQCAAGSTVQVLGEIRAELRKLAREPMGDDELRRLKQFVSSSLASTLDTPFTIADYYQGHLISATPQGYLRRQLESLRSLTPQVIMDMASRYFDPEKLCTVTAGSPC